MPAHAPPTALSTPATQRMKSLLVPLGHTGGPTWIIPSPGAHQRAVERAASEKADRERRQEKKDKKNPKPTEEQIAEVAAKLAKLRERREFRGRPAGANKRGISSTVQQPGTITGNSLGVAPKRMKYTHQNTIEDSPMKPRVKQPKHPQSPDACARQGIDDEPSGISGPHHSNSGFLVDETRD